jgi:hypothetical protein
MNEFSSTYSKTGIKQLNMIPRVLFQKNTDVPAEKYFVPTALVNEDMIFMSVIDLKRLHTSTI